jgi:hypothetical protein
MVVLGCAAKRAQTSDEQNHSTHRDLFIRDSWLRRCAFSFSPSTCDEIYSLLEKVFPSWLRLLAKMKISAACRCCRFY